MRGFVITILSISLSMILAILAISFYNAQLSIERVLIEPLPLIYAAFLLDDVGYELNSIIGPEITIDERNDSTRVMVIDPIHGYNHSSDILVYEAFLTSEVASRTASNITTNFTNLTEGMIRLFINEDYVYTNDHDDKELFFTKAGGTGATSYYVNFTVAASRSNVTHMEFNSNGTMNVTITYTDLDGTDVEEGKLFPDQANTFKVDYMGGGSMIVTAGQSGGNSGSLRIRTSGFNTDVSWLAVLPPLDAEKKMGYEYDATISYVQGQVAKHSRIGK